MTDRSVQGSPPPGALLRDWRRRRNLSQLDFAHGAGVSPRHVSFIETGRSRPTSGMILRLCDQLQVPLREQNRLLLAGGFAPAHPELALTDPPLAQVSAAIDAILNAHLPWPALVIDGAWDLVAANDAVYRLLDGVAAHLLEPPVNVVRLTLESDGLAPRIANLSQWREDLLARLRREHEASGDERLADLVRAYDDASAPAVGLPHSWSRWCSGRASRSCRSSPPRPSSARPARSPSPSSRSRRSTRQTTSPGRHCRDPSANPPARASRSMDASITPSRPYRESADPPHGLPDPVPGL